MAKRITQKRLEKYGLLAGYIGVPTAIVILSILISLGSITVGEYSSNEVCGGNVPCWLNMTDVCFKEDVFIYPMNGSSLINARPTDTITSLTLYRGWGTGLREIPLDKGCTGSWCGKLKSDKREEAIYSYAFRAGKCYDLYYKVYKPMDSTISWSINPSGQWKTTYYYTGYNTTLQNLTGYNMVIENYTIEHDCSSVNETCEQDYNETIFYNNSIPIYENYTVMYPWNRTGINFHVDPPNKDFYIPFYKYTGSMKDDMFTIKGPFNRGATWYDKDLDSCYNTGIPCKQFNISKNGIGKFSEIEKSITDTDGVGVKI